MIHLRWSKVPLLVLLCISGSTSDLLAEPPVVASLWEEATLVHLLTPALADSLHINLTSQYDVRGSQQVFLLTSNGNLFDLSRRRLMLTEVAPDMTSFTISERLLVTVSGGLLGWYEDGKIRQRIRLPMARMQVVAGSGQRLYLYGHQKDRSRVFLLEDDKVLPLIETSRGTISALTVIGERVFFAINNEIYTVSRGERPGLVFLATGETAIRSLAADPRAGLLYFSAGETIYAMRAGVAVSVMKGLKGYLRYSKDGLFVLDPARKRLVKVVGLEKLTINPGADTTPLQNKFKE